MIEKLVVENFRSIKNATIHFDRLNPIIGPNNAGKSNIIRALNLVLGEAYPRPTHFDANDFYNGDTNKTIKIEVHFQKPTVNSDFGAKGFQLTFDGDVMSYLALGLDGEPGQHDGRRPGNVRVNGDMREEVAVLYVGTDRQAAHQLRTSQATLYGRILRHIEKKISDSSKAAFQETIRGAFNDHVLPNITELQEILTNCVRGQAGVDAELQFNLLDSTSLLSGLNPEFLENSFCLSPTNAGSGIQSSLSIAIARAYAQIVKECVILIIEEPELYLHPHGCRHFYKTLAELSNEVQVIYSTHESAFVDITNYASINLVRKQDGQTVICSGKNAQTAFQNPKRFSKFNPTTSETLFSNCTILVEGPCDRVACQVALDLLGVDIDAKSISIVECGGIQDVNPIAEVLKHFNIPVYALVDEDPAKPASQSEITKLKATIGQDKVFLQRPDLEGEFGYTAGKFNKGHDNVYFESQLQQSMPQIYQDLMAVLLVT